MLNGDSGEEVTNDEHHRLWKKAKNFAEARGFGDEAEDFASSLVLRKLEGKSLKQSLEQSLIDYLDSLRAHKRILGSPSGYLSKGVRFSIDEPFGSQNNDGSTISGLVGSFRDGLAIDRELEFYCSILTGKERIIFELYSQGATLKEIAKEFGVTESRASQMMTKLENKIKNLKEGVDLLSFLSASLSAPEAVTFAMNTFKMLVKGK